MASALADDLSHRLLLSTSAPTAATFQAAVARTSTIEVTANIPIESGEPPITISGVDGLKVNGNSFIVSRADSIGRCFTVSGFTTSVDFFDLTIQNCRLVGAPGGGFHVSQASISLTRCVIQSCHVNGYYGAGLFVSSGSSISMVDTQILSNTASNYHAGGMFIGESFVDMLRCTVRGNLVSGQGGGIFVDSGSTLTMAESMLESNEAHSGTGGAIFISSSASVNLRACELVGNIVGRLPQWTGNGGAIAMAGQTATLNLIGCSFLDNAAGENGANPSDDLYVASSTNTVTVFSSCPLNSFRGDGGVSLECQGCSSSYSKHLKGACSSCASGTAACCGATECSSSLAVCSLAEESLCSYPTHNPSIAPSVSTGPSVEPSVSPTMVHSTQISAGAVVTPLIKAGVLHAEEVYVNGVSVAGISYDTRRHLLSSSRESIDDDEVRCLLQAQQAMIYHQNSVITQMKLEIETLSEGISAIRSHLDGSAERPMGESSRDSNMAD